MGLVIEVVAEAASEDGGCGGVRGGTGSGWWRFE